MRIRMVREHDAKSIEQNVDTLFRSEPADEQELLGLWLDASGPGEERDIRTIVNMAASLCQRRKASANARSDKITAAQHQVSSIDARLDHRRVKLLEPLTLHMQHNSGLWQPRSDKGNELRKIH